MARGEENGRAGGAPPASFADPGRISGEDLAEVVKAAGGSQLVGRLMKIFGGTVAVLDEHRQVVAVNGDLLRFLGAEDAEGLLGLRPGEVLSCVHAHDHPGGCGTGRFCSTCGAAIAVALAQRDGEPHERECLLTVGPGRETALELLVRAAPLQVGGIPMVLLLLRDIRVEKRRQGVERVFFHDVMNALQGLMGYAELLQTAAPERCPELGRRILALTSQLADEVRSQQLLAKADAGEYVLQPAAVPLGEIAAGVRAAAESNPAARGRRLSIELPGEEIWLTTDPALLHRVLLDMVKNALEATPEGGEVRLRCRVGPEAVSWKVWNEGAIPGDAALRIFQRYFSTKGQPGRGLGTYGMKLLGERYLGGSVGFTTSENEGTAFTFDHPLQAS